MHYLSGFAFSEEDGSQCLTNVVNGNVVFLRAEFLELRIVLQDKDECKLILSLLHDTLNFQCNFGGLRSQQCID